MCVLVCVFSLLLCGQAVTPNLSTHPLSPNFTVAALSWAAKPFRYAHFNDPTVYGGESETVEQHQTLFLRLLLSFPLLLLFFEGGFWGFLFFVFCFCFLFLFFLWVHVRPVLPTRQVFPFQRLSPPKQIIKRAMLYGTK